MVSGLAVTHAGAEKILCDEISEITKSKPSAIEKGLAIFQPKSISDLLRFCYLTRISEGVLLYLAEIPVKDIESRDIFSDVDFHKFLHKKKFRVDCRSSEELDTGKNELEARIGRIILDKVPSASVSLEEPDIIIAAVVSGSRIYLGVDLCGFDLSRRDYRIFGHSRTIKSTVAASLLRLGGFSDSVMDPFGGAGIIVIEAALYSANRPVHYHQKHRFAFNSMKDLLGVEPQKITAEADRKIKTAHPEIIYLNQNHHHIASARKNAKIADVEKFIRFSRQAIEWAELSCRKSGMDLIATQLPEKSRFFRKETIKKLYQELFYQADYILKKKGRVAVVASDEAEVRLAAEKRNFRIAESCAVMQGKKELRIILLKRNGE